jgi:hypothetical protein
VPALTSAHKNFLVERTTPEHFRKATRTHFLLYKKKATTIVAKQKRLTFYANREFITTRLEIS